MNPLRKIADRLMNWWKGETAPEVSDSTELTGGVMTLNSPSFLESMGLSRKRNQNGYNYLDKLKDKDGKYILQPNPTQPTQMMLFGKYPIVKVSNRTVKSEPVYSPAFTISGSKLAIDGTTTAIDASATSDVTAWKVVKGKYVVTCKGQEQETTVDAKVSAYKHPVYMGDLKEAITLFDRNVITIDMNDKAAGLWEKDMTGIKVRDRFDVQPVDDGAIIKGNITEVVQG